VETARGRRGTVADVPALAELRRAWTLEEEGSDARPRDDFEDAFTSVVADGIESGRWVVWVAEADGQIVSHAFVCVVDRIPRPIEQLPAIGYLTNVYTRPDHRGSGLGGRVLEEVTAWARDVGIELLVVWPSEESVPFYERHGFGSRGTPLVWLHPRGGD
jgi:GNAT superfamily N-acetyltransferase